MWNVRDMRNRDYALAQARALLVQSPRILRAVEVADYAHLEQRRKGKPNVYYVTHPITVALKVQGFGASEDAVIAALFHDILEDVPERYSREEMLAEFGGHVVELVDAVTEDKIPDHTERRRRYQAQLRAAPVEARMIKAADIWHNVWDTLDDYRVRGEEAFAAFNQDKRNPDIPYPNCNDGASRILYKYYEAAWNLIACEPESEWAEMLRGVRADIVATEQLRYDRVH